MINPGGIEQILNRLDPAALVTEVRRLRSAANGIRETGENVDDAWTHGLNPHVYDAPEGDLLRRAARPVQTTTAEFAWQLWRVAGALDAYAAELAPIKARLQSLLTDARALVAEINAKGDDWTEDEDLVDQNNDLEAAVRGQVTALAAAEERCAAQIYAAYGGHAPGPMCVDGPSTPPWGTAEKADLPWWEDAVNGAGRFFQGMWDVTWGGISTLAGLQGGEKFTEAWKGLGKMALASFIVSFPGGASLLAFDPVRDLVGKSHKETVKGLTAWDEWRRDPARAAGQVAGNALMLATTKKAGPPAATAAGKAAQAAVRAGRAIDPMTHVIWTGTKLRNFYTGLRGTPVRLDDSLPTFTHPNGGFEEVGRPTFGPRDPALTGAPPHQDPHPVNSSHNPPNKDPDTPPPTTSPRDTPPTTPATSHDPPPTQPG
ncbi:hypothetical protein, partial [Actinomadura sp. 9N215]|uniref:hypothetical protein n=1 Tax=Actinomadura sp. 9N215 TaxID=3375150 RepID=UPI0037B0444C